MSLSLTQTKTALAVGLTASFLGGGGTEPYVYSVLPGGAGGSIDSDTGIYTAPVTITEDPSLIFDTIQVQDFLGAVATSQILVGTPLMLFCEIIQRELGLANDHVFIWDQKIFQPTDSSLYVVISVPRVKPFANTVGPALVNGVPDWSMAEQRLNVMATLDINAISRGPEARTRKEEIVLALNSIYSEAQQEANSFYIGKIPPGAQFNNLSQVDGAAIPYRYQISVNMQYTVVKRKAVDYFDTFSAVEVATQP